MGRSPKVRLGWAYRACVVIAKSAILPFSRHEWRGAEHLDRPGGVVVCCNHLSHLDFLVLAHFLYDNGRPPFFLAKDSAFRVPVLGWLITKGQQIPVYRNSGRAVEAYRAAIAAVREGRTVPIYPEGTITRDPDLWPMTGKTGAARIALETGCPVIPVAQWGVQEIMAPYSGRVRLLPRKTVRVLAGPPVDLADLQALPVTGEVVREATDRIMADVVGLLEQLRGEQAPAERYDVRRHRGES